MGHLVILEISDDSSTAPNAKTFHYFPGKNMYYYNYLDECILKAKQAIRPNLNAGIVSEDTEMVKGCMYFASCDHTSKIFRYASIRDLSTAHKRGGNKKNDDIKLVEVSFTSHLPHSDKMRIVEKKETYKCFSDDILMNQYIDDYVTECMMQISEEAKPKERNGKPYIVDSIYRNDRSDKSVILTTCDGWEKRINVFIHKIKYN